MAENATRGNIDDLVKRISRLVRDAGLTVAVAESLTGGQLSTALAAAADSSRWYRGAVVAYTPGVKFEVLGVPRGPVVTARAARTMAEGVRALLGADIGVSVTGVGGPGPEEGKPAGTVFLCVSIAAQQPVVAEHHFDGDPVHVLHATIEHALEALLAVLRR